MKGAFGKAVRTRMITRSVICLHNQLAPVSKLPKTYPMSRCASYSRQSNEKNGISRLSGLTSSDRCTDLNAQSSSRSLKEVSEVSSSDVIDMAEDERDDTGVTESSSAHMRDGCWRDWRNGISFLIAEYSM